MGDSSSAEFFQSQVSSQDFLHSWRRNAKLLDISLVLENGDMSRNFCRTGPRKRLTSSNGC
jgi:hypothetical protein